MSTAIDISKEKMNSWSLFVLKMYWDFSVLFGICEIQIQTIKVTFFNFLFVNSTYTYINHPGELHNSEWIILEENKSLLRRSDTNIVSFKIHSETCLGFFVSSFPYSWRIARRVHFSFQVDSVRVQELEYKSPFSNCCLAAKGWFLMDTVAFFIWLLKWRFQKDCSLLLCASAVLSKPWFAQL